MKGGQGRDRMRSGEWKERFQGEPSSERGSCRTKSTGQHCSERDEKSFFTLFVLTARLGGSTTAVMGQSEEDRKRMGQVGLSKGRGARYAYVAVLSCRGAG